MFRLSLFSAFISLIIIVSSSTAVLSSDNRKILSIEGLRIFRSEELKKILNLEPDKIKNTTENEIIRRITDFYQKNGYSLVKVHIIESTPENLTLYVDEGRLAKIIIHDLNNYYSLKVKQIIDFPGRIYNTEIAEQNISKIKKKYKFSQIRVEFNRIADYSDSFFQIDRELKKINAIGYKLKIFEDYPAEYDLHFYPSRDGAVNGFSLNRDGLAFNIDYGYPSEFIPEVSYYKNNLFAEKDFFEVDGSTGFDPGIKGFISFPPANTLNIPPERSFSQIKWEYKFHPYNNDFFGPLINGKFYQSKSSREDLGLSKYQYFLSRGVLAPEFTLLKYFNIYAGFGYERVLFYDTKIDETADKHYDIVDSVDNHPFVESRIKIDPIPIRIGNRIDKYLLFTLTEYMGDSRSREMEMTCAYDFEFSDLSIYSFKFKSNLNYYDTPFYHNDNVSSEFFKGFTGKGYYTNSGISVSNEYRVSVYQDYIYAGAFIDVVAFEPEGYIMSGKKFGVAAGPTGRFLFYDQFELIVYYSIDHLFPDDKYGTNLQAKFRKKW